MVTPERLESMQQTWARQLERLQNAPNDAYPVFDELVARYQEAWRHYHTLEHIHEILKVVGKLSDQATDPDALYLAVWFHDAIYNPRAKDNEEQSAKLAERCLTTLGLARPTIERVMEMIGATAHGTTTSAQGDTAILLDADLAILGAEEKRYQRYAADIRREYDWVSDADYKTGRSHVLEAFLKRERIYSTERMFASGETLARANLLAELRVLLGD